MPKQHAWEAETVNGGPIGDSDFWVCHACGASGGSVYLTRGEPTPFLSGLGYGTTFSQDCDEARQQIDKILSSKGWLKKRLIEVRMYAEAAIREVKNSYGIEVKLARRGILYGGWPDRTGRAFQFEPKELRSTLGWTLTAHDGATQEFRNYNDILAWVHAFYGPIVLGAVSMELETLLGPKGFMITNHHGHVHGVNESGRPPFKNAFSVKKPGSYDIRIFKAHPTPTEHWTASTVEEVCGVLYSRLGLGG